jgi:putative sugar O-methyltransferase
LMSYEAAFNAVMGSANISVPIISKHTVNHRLLVGKEGVLDSSDAVAKHYERWSGNRASANVLMHYYYQNIFRGQIPKEKLGTVVEIGAGNGNFPSILYHDWAPVRIILIDLPESIAVAIPYLSSLFPDAVIVMPHEAQRSGLPAEFDFAFLTVDQLDLLADDSVDLAINCHSFQEMTPAQIEIYFALVQRICREAGFFFAANRIEKIPTGNDPFNVEQTDLPVRFAEYPWDKRNDVLVYESSRLSRLVQLDDVGIRLEQIHK